MPQYKTASPLKPKLVQPRFGISNDEFKDFSKNITKRSDSSKPYIYTIAGISIIPLIAIISASGMLEKPDALYVGHTPLPDIIPFDALLGILSLFSSVLSSLIGIDKFDKLSKLKEAKGQLDNQIEIHKIVTDCTRQIFKNIYDKTAAVEIVEFTKKGRLKRRHKGYLDQQSSETELTINIVKTKNFVFWKKYTDKKLTFKLSDNIPFISKHDGKYYFLTPVDKTEAIIDNLLS